MIHFQNNMKQAVIFTACLLFGLQGFAQEDLLDLIDEDPKNQPIIFTSATFKGTRLINQQTSQMPAKGVMQYVFMHRFGAFSDDFFYNFLGLDQAVVLLTLDYSPTDWLNLGLGRSSESKTYEGYAKFRMLRQSSGGRTMPISLTGYATINYSALRYTDNLPHNSTDRLSYSYQLIAARKFSERFSMQIVPTLVHFNFVETVAQHNDIFAVGFGARFKLNNRLALTAEYTPQLPKNTYLDVNTGQEMAYNNALSVGVDIETGGHVFQLHFTNSRALVDPLWVARTQGDWLNGDIYFGFNVSRVFTLVKPKVPDEPNF